MRRVRIVAGLFLLATGSAAGATEFQEGERLRVALFPFAAKSFSAGEAALIRDRVRTVMEQQRRYDVMTDAVLQTMMSDFGLSNLDECQLPSCLAVIGSRLGVQQVVQGSFEPVDSVTSALTVKLVNVPDGKLLLSRKIVLRAPLSSVAADALNVLSDDLKALALEQESSFRWFHIAGAILVAGVTIYLVSKGIADRRNREFEDTKDPPPPPGN
jgi:hypothetical protein